MFTSLESAETIDIPVTGANGIPLGYATVAVVYAALAVAVAWLLRRLSQAPMDLPEQAAHAEAAP